MDGTRIGLVRSSPEGFEFFINSPMTKYRNELYKEEMNHAFLRFVDGLKSVMKGGATPGQRRDAFNKALLMFFYWVNFAPLSRGTSATGYAGLMACVVALGDELLDPVPKGKQLDLEGIFTSDPHEFVDRVGNWLSRKKSTEISMSWLDSKNGRRLSDIFSTSRAMLAAIGALD